MRATVEGHITGHAAVFDQEYVLWEDNTSRVVETVKRGTFSRALREKHDVRADQQSKPPPEKEPGAVRDLPARLGSLNYSDAFCKHFTGESLEPVAIASVALLRTKDS
jgi:hypothetical protein